MLLKLIEFDDTGGTGEPGPLRGLGSCWRAFEFAGLFILLVIGHYEFI